MLDFEAWSDLAARVAGLPADARDAILRGRGIRPEDWQAAEQHYNALLLDDVVHDRMERRRTYGRKCAVEVARRKQPGENAGAAAAEEPAPSAPAVRSAENGPAEKPRAVEVTTPTFLAERPPEGSAGSGAPGLGIGTVELFDLATFLKPKREAALPFVPTAQPSALAVPSGTPEPTRPGFGATVELDVEALRKVQPPVPYGDPGPRSDSDSRATPALSLQAYASLCAELGVFPQRANEIMNRYGIRSEADRRSLDARWHAIFATDPAQRAEWQRLCSTYRDWLARQAGSR